MRFELSEGTLGYWKEKGYRAASEAEIALLQAGLNQPLPASYLAFMRQFGKVTFDYDQECEFEVAYLQESPVRRERCVMGYIAEPERALRHYVNLQAYGQPDPEGWLLLPRHLLPFASDRGQGQLLIECGRATQCIYYCDLDDHDWGAGEAKLAFVANDLYEFINGLKRIDFWP